MVKAHNREGVKTRCLICKCDSRLQILSTIYRHVSLIILRQ